MTLRHRILTYSCLVPAALGLMFAGAQSRAQDAAADAPENTSGGSVNAAFEDVTAQVGLSGLYAPEPSAWGDYNNDGWVDLLDGSGRVVSITIEHARQQTDVGEFIYQLAAV